jgi:hypothetical protein
MFGARYQSMSRPFHEVSLSNGSSVLRESVPAARIFGEFSQKKMFAFTEFAPHLIQVVTLEDRRTLSRKQKVASETSAGRYNF